jgi:hypothetical protein
MRDVAVATLVALMGATASGQDHSDGHQWAHQQLDRRLRGTDSNPPRIDEPRQYVLPQDKAGTVTKDETIIEKLEGYFGRSSARPDFDVVSQDVAVGDAATPKASMASMPITFENLVNSLEQHSVTSSFNPFAFQQSATSSVRTQGTMEGLQTNDPYLSLCSLYNCTIAKDKVFDTTPVTNMFTVPTFPPVAGTNWSACISAKLQCDKRHHYR